MISVKILTCELKLFVFSKLNLINKASSKTSKISIKLIRIIHTVNSCYNELYVLDLNFTIRL